MAAKARPRSSCCRVAISRQRSASDEAATRSPCMNASRAAAPTALPPSKVSAADCRLHSPANRDGRWCTARRARARPLPGSGCGGSCRQTLPGHVHSIARRHSGASFPEGGIARQLQAGRPPPAIDRPGWPVAAPRPHVEDPAAQIASASASVEPPANGARRSNRWRSGWPSRS